MKVTVLYRGKEIEVSATVFLGTDKESSIQSRLNAYLNRFPVIARQKGLLLLASMQEIIIKKLIFSKLS